MSSDFFKAMVCAFSFSLFNLRIKLDMESERKITSAPVPNFELFSVKNELGMAPKLLKIKNVIPNANEPIPTVKNGSTGIRFTYMVTMVPINVNKINSANALMYK